MKGKVEVTRLRPSNDAAPTCQRCRRSEGAVDLLRDADALLAAIDRGELLAALPEDPASADRHEDGLRLLALAHKRLRAALSGLGD